MRKFSCQILLSLLLAVGVAWSAEEPCYDLSSREFTAGTGEAVSAEYLRNVVSREFTAGTGEAVSAEYLRNVVSREFTAGVGKEVLTITPAREFVAGEVTLRLDGEFVANPLGISLSWSLCHGAKEVAGDSGLAWGEFGYLWDTTLAEDGAYDLVVRIERPTQADVLVTQRYYVFNDSCHVHAEEYVFDDEVWENDGLVHLVDGEVYIADGASLTVEPGAIVKFTNDSSLYVANGGILDLSGAILTHFADDSKGGDTNGDGAQTAPEFNRYTINVASTGELYTDADTEFCYLVFTYSGKITEDTTWMGNCLIVVTDNLTIASGATLTILPGAIVKMRYQKSITVASGGTLNAIGNRAQPIVFTSYWDDDHGGDTDKSADVVEVGDWKSISVYGTANLSYCSLMYGAPSNESGIVDVRSGGALTMNCCTVAHALYDGVWNWGGSLTMNNCVVTDCGNAVAPYQGTNIFTNCVFYDDSYALMYWSNWNGKPIFTNCVFKDMTVNWIENNGWSGAYSAVTFNHCLFHNASTLATQSMRVVGSNGNLWADPLFNDPENGDFTLRAGSPCIDAGNGSVANLPQKDYYGNPRSRNDGHVTPTGIADAEGNYPDIGIFEMCDEVDSDLDLVANWITSGSSAVAGDTVTVRWQVANIGTATGMGVRRDSIYLVAADEQLGSRQVLLGNALVSGRLAPNGVLEYEAEVVIPAVSPGSWCFAVFANEQRDWFEGKNTTNNFVVSRNVCAVSLPRTSLATLSEWAIPPEGTLGLRLTDVPATGALLVVRGYGMLRAAGAVGTLPESVGQGWTAMDLGNGTVLLQIPPIPEGQEVFVLLENEAAEEAWVDIEALTDAFALFYNGKITASNNGTVTIPLYGVGLSEDMEIWLTQGGDRLESIELTLSATGAYYATFDVADATVGEWTLHASNENGSDSYVALSLNKALKGAQWYCRLELPSAIRRGRTVVGTFVYGNSGDMDMDAPYIKIEGEAGVNVRLSENDSWGKLFEFLALSGTYPVSRLKAGEERRQNFEFIQVNDASSVKIKYEYVSQGKYTHYFKNGEDLGYSPTPFPWDTNGKLMRPEWATDAVWGKILARLKMAVGPSWNSYFDRMRSNADYLAMLGQPTNDLSVLWQLDVREALAADNAVSTLASATDLVRSGRGFDISISRSYSSSLESKNTAGIFGMGWTMPYETKATLMDNGETLELELPGGSSYVFVKQNGTWVSTIPRDKNSLEESGSEYILSYPNGKEMRYGKSSGRLLAMRDCNGNGLDFSYAGDRLGRITHTDGQWVKLSYDGNFVAKVEDDLGHSVTYKYDRLYRQQLESNGTYISVRVNNSNLVAVASDDGLVTRYAFDMSRVLYPDGSSLDYTFDEMGRVATISRNGNQQTITIDRGQFGCYSVIDADGAVTDTVVGASGEVLYTIDALGNKTTLKYDNDMAAVTAIQTPMGRSVHYEYDKDFNVTRGVAPDGTATQFTYSVDFSGLESYTDAKGQTVSYAFDEKGQGTGNTLADGKGGSVTYNAKGDVVETSSRAGTVSTLEYDDEGRIIRTTDADGRTVEMQYGTKGEVIKVSDSQQGDIAFEYTDAERLRKITYPDGRGFTYEYDDCGRVAKQTTSDGFTQCYEYDALGRISKMTDKNGKLFVSLEYDTVTGMLLSKTFGNGASVHYAYDLNGNLLSIVHKGKNGKELESFQYAYNADGLRTQVESSEGVESYTYDLAGQLTEVTYPDGTTETFQYDAVGNRITANGEAYTVNELNQYLTAGDASFTYDDNGNMTSRTDAEGVTTYEYDANSRLVRVVKPDGTEWSCQYDALGNRTQVNDNSQIRNNLYTFGEMSSLVAEYDSAGKLIRRYILLGNTLIADMDASGNYRYYHADGLGSTRLLTDKSGTAVGRQSYDAFGEVRTSSGETTHFGYVGTYGVEADVTGLVFMRNRYYAADLGRFISLDPIGISAGDFNWYRYCANNPILYIDKLGYYSEDCPIHGHGNKANGFGYTVVSGGSTFGGAMNSGYASYWEHANTQFYTYGPSYNQHYGSYNKMHINRANRIGKAVAVLDMGVAGFDIGAGIAEGGAEEGARRAYEHGGALAGAAVGAKALGSIGFALFGPPGAAIGAAMGGIGGGIVGGIGGKWFGETVLPPPDCGNGPPDGKGGSAGASSPQSCDPNEMVGQLGFGDEETERFVVPGEPLTYTINFENKSSASAAAQEVFVDTQLSEYLDWSTFELGSVLFSNQTEMGLEGRQRGKILVDRQNTNQKVQIEVTMNASTGKVRWYLRSYDPNTTDHWPSSVYDGFLPPNDDNHAGEGSLTYRIKVKEDAPHNARIDASAEIIFDTNAMIPTDPAWFNTVYVKAPTDDFEPSLPDGSAVLNPSNVGWAEVPGASEYDVTLWKVENGRDVQVAAATGLKMGHWDISEFVGYGETTVTYHWQVVARNGLGTAASPVYSFRVLGDDQRMSYKLLPGWNLVAVPFLVEEEVGGQELFELAPQVYERLAGSFVQAVGSVPGGTGMWLFAPENQELQVWTAVEMTAAPCLPPELQKGWNLAGICGTEELLVDCTAEGITAIWRWNGTRLEPVVIEDGVALLQPFVGYWIQLE